MNVIRERFLSVGSDPELMLLNQQGKVVSAIDYIPGTKRQPLKVKHGYIQHDNIMAEFNSKPANTVEEFIRNHELIMQELTDFVSKHNLSLDLINSSVMADPLLLSNPETMRSGCEPDYNAWSEDGKDVNNPPSYYFSDLRACGGHVHIAFDQAVEDPFSRVVFARCLDMVLGVPSVVLDVNGAERKTLYGKAGAVRYKYKGRKTRDPYDGIEYRVLSNFWLSSTHLQRWVWNGVSEVYSDMHEVYAKASFYKDIIISIINNNDVTAAKKFCKMNGLSLA